MALHRQRQRGAFVVRIEIAGAQVIERDAVSVPPQSVPNNDLLTALGCEVNDAGWVVADRTARTSVAGVWVAGIVANPRAVISAVGEGSAAIAINADLVDEDVRNFITATTSD